jgi:hypothetical protein
MCLRVDKIIDKINQEVSAKLYEICLEHDLEDVAKWAGTTKEMMKKFRNKNADAYNIPFANAIMLGRILQDEHSDNSMLIIMKGLNVSLWVTDAGEGNGSLKEECESMVTAMGLACVSYQGRDKKSYLEQVKNMKTAVTDFEAEADKL